MFIHFSAINLLRDISVNLFCIYPLHERTELKHFKALLKSKVLQFIVLKYFLKDIFPDEFILAVKLCSALLSLDERSGREKALPFDKKKDLPAKQFVRKILFSLKCLFPSSCYLSTYIYPQSSIKGKSILVVFLSLENKCTQKTAFYLYISIRFIYAFHRLLSGNNNINTIWNKSSLLLGFILRHLTTDKSGNEFELHSYCILSSLALRFSTEIQFRM